MLVNHAYPTRTYLKLWLFICCSILLSLTSNAQKGERRFGNPGNNTQPQPKQREIRQPAPRNERVDRPQRNPEVRIQPTRPQEIKPAPPTNQNLPKKKFITQPPRIDDQQQTPTAPIKPVKTVTPANTIPANPVRPNTPPQQNIIHHDQHATVPHERPVVAEQRYNRPEYNRHVVYNAHNPGWRYAYFPRRHTHITYFSFPYRTIYWSGYNYRYCDGIFYRPYDSYYEVVPAPFGIYIDILPYGYRRMYVNNYPYYYFNGTFYDDYNSSYRVVAPPEGAIVESIPEPYETIVINGETYYKVDGVQYKPVVQANGEIWYEVIKSR